MEASQSQNEDLEEVEEQDFQEPIFLPTDSSGSRKRALSQTSIDEESDDDLEETEIVTVCPICHTEWTNNGTHRIVSIRCGHVFGKSCIDSHIKDMCARFGSASCPICPNVGITKYDPRRVWPTKLLPDYEKELLAMRNQLDEASKALVKLVQKNTSVKNEIDRYKSELELLDAKNPSSSDNQCTNESVQTAPRPRNQFMYLDKVTLPNEAYNVIDLNPNLDMAVISTHKFLCHTFGFRKVNLVDPTVTEFIPTSHKGTIRDVTHSPTGMLLSTGDDKSLKLTSTKNNLVVQSYVLNAPAAACSFDTDDTNILYCGLTTGTLMVYDIRNTSTHTHMLESPSHLDPIISVAAYPNSVVCTDEWGSFSWFKGPVGQYLHKSLDFFDKTEEIDIFGSQILSVDYNDDSFLYSMLSEQRTKYLVGHLSNNANHEPQVMQQDWCFESTVTNNPSLKARNTHFKRGDDVYICYADKNKVYLRDREKQTQEIEFDEPMLDIKYTKIGQEELLVTLSRQELQLFKYYK